jgi:hypothetical protein
MDGVMVGEFVSMCMSVHEQVTEWECKWVTKYKQVSVSKE